MLRPDILSIFLSLFLLCSGHCYAQAADQDPAVALQELLEQKERLLADIAQYQQSIDLIGAAGAEGNPAMGALQEQLQTSLQLLAQIEVRELRLREEVSHNRSAEAEPMPPVSSDEEVMRLKQLLSGYYAEQAREAEALARASSEPEPEPEFLGAQQFAPDQVMLNGNQGVAAIEQISSRMQSTAYSSQGRVLDIIFQVAIRREGRLVGSSSHSLRPLGAGQYIAKIRVESGSARIRVKNDQWTVELPGDGPSEYLVTLNQPRGQTPELHVISVAELKATHWTDVPDWLPPVGIEASKPGSE